MKIRVLLPILLTAVVVHAREVTAQESPPPACAGPEFHQFDFWIGSWDVTAQDRVVGHNDIVPFAGGCGLLENWTAGDGSGGKSINAWRPTEKRWTQHWVGAGGTILDLSGGLVDGRMVLSGPARQTPNGPVLDRITWIPVSPDTVRQIWDLSTDEGTNWRTVFSGTYVRKKRE